MQANTFSAFLDNSQNLRKPNNGHVVVVLTVKQPSNAIRN